MNLNTEDYFFDSVDGLRLSLRLPSICSRGTRC
jgi:hypothetical protein